MKISKILAVLVVLALQALAAPADDTCGKHADEIASVYWRGSPDRAMSLGVEANGLVRYLRDGAPEDELWLESWVVQDIVQSLHHLATSQEAAGDPSAEEQVSLRVSLACRGTDGDREVSFLVSRVSDLGREFRAVESWLRNLLAPMWVSGPRFLEICDPQYRRSVGLEVIEPVWCAGKFGPDPLEDPETRQRLIERLRKVARE